MNAEERFSGLSDKDRLEICDRVFRVLEFDPHGNPGREWNSDVLQDISEVFSGHGVTFTDAEV